MIHSVSNVSRKEPQTEEKEIIGQLWNKNKIVKTTSHVFFHLSNDLQMACLTACGSSITFLDYQEQKIFFSNHLSSLRNALKGNLVELFGPKNLVLLLMYKSLIIYKNKKPLRLKKNTKILKKKWHEMTFNQL